LQLLDMTVYGDASDSAAAARMMCRMNVGAIIVLGGDGTHRVVVSEAGDVPIAGVSTGTNNAFPEMREPTITGLAAGLAVTGAVPAGVAFAGNKRLDVAINDRHEIALVDVAIVRERFVGSRAIWKAESFRELFVAFAEPGSIGLSSIVGLVAPVKRSSPFGRRLVFDDPADAQFRVAAPIAPGLIEGIGIARVETLDFDTPTALTVGSGSIALDGEREITFSERDRISVTLREAAFRTIDVSACMSFAAGNGLFVETTKQALSHALGGQG
jgi:predicted polyphosphate/ATP-dependent NAD kinase